MAKLVLFSTAAKGAHRAVQEEAEEGRRRGQPAAAAQRRGRRGRLLKDPRQELLLQNQGRGQICEGHTANLNFTQKSG